MDKTVVPDKVNAADKQCLGEGKLLFQTGAGGAGLAVLGKSTYRRSELQSQTGLDGQPWAVMDSYERPFPTSQGGLSNTKY